MNQQPHIIRYKAAFFRAQRFLNTVGISLFPFDVFKMPELLSRFCGLNVFIQSQSDYNAFLQAIGKKPKQFKNGLCIYDPARDVYLILYNETHVATRIRFTVMHEIGHIVLKHLSDEETELARGGLPSLKYLHYEGEANTFAGNALAPPILIHEFLNGKPFVCRTIQTYFRMSEPAVRDYREKDYAAWLETKPYKCEIELLERCLPQIHVRHCLACKATFFGKDAKYCIICGHNRLSKFWSDDYMKYETVATNEDGRVSICTRCENEELDDEYCKICGAPIVNRCCDERDCGIVVDGNARYCSRCGCQTTFFQADILKDWKTERGIKKDEPKELAASPEEDDGELPF